MSEFADDMEAMRECQKKKKADRLKWDTDVLLFLAGELDYRVKKHSDFHYSIFHPRHNGRLDYWPSTGKAMWVSRNKQPKVFLIPDLEQYILKHFKTT